jgi:prepilin-type processing-associated H-X9-DG protein
MFSWIVLILPQIEQAALHNAFDFDQSVLAQPGDPQARRLPALLCPSDSGGAVLADLALTNLREFAKGNYAAFASPYHLEFQHLFPGVINTTSRRMADVRDGTSQTLMLSEVRTRDNRQDQRGAWALPWCGASALAFDLHHLGSAGGGSYVADPAFLYQAQPPNNQGPNVDMLYACVDPAGAILARMPCNLVTPAPFYISGAPRSLHPGGVNVAYADGHVAFLSENINRLTMAYLISINDGQAVDLP